jgi:hypothetical protein
MTRFAYERVAAGLPMPGVVEVSLNVTYRTAIEDLILIAFCGDETEFAGQIRYLPLR